MRPPSGRAFALALAALFVGLTVFPIAAADHAYSHRYLVYGRVLDANGLPVPSVRVNVGFDNKLAFESFCADQPGTETEAWGATTTRATTNAQGEFFFCFHMHAISRGTNADAHVEYNGVEAKAPIDFRFRKSFLTLVVPNATGVADETFTEKYLVSGKVWDSDPGKIVEGVTVQGKTMDHTPVKITYETASGEKITAETHTNNYGDFAVRMPVTKAMGAGRVTIEAANETRTYDADVQSRWTDVNFRVDEPSSAGSTALKLLGGVVVVGAVVGGGYAVYRTMASKREDALARERSTRKRAQR